MRRRRHELCSCCCGRGAEGDAKRQAELWVASGQLPLQHRETGEEEILLNLLQRINTLRFVGRISQQRVLNELTLPPSLSPGALQYIAERTEKLALGVEPSNDTSDSICDGTGIPLTPTPSTTTPSHHHTLTSSTYNSREVSTATADSSVIGQICCELDECEQSLDDRMMREVSVSVALHSHHFREQLDGLRQERTQQYEQERASRKRRAELEQARAEAEELQQ